MIQLDHAAIRIRGATRGTAPQAPVSHSLATTRRRTLYKTYEEITFSQQT